MTPFMDDPLTHELNENMNTKLYWMISSGLKAQSHRMCVCALLLFCLLKMLVLLIGPMLLSL